MERQTDGLSVPIAQPPGRQAAQPGPPLRASPPHADSTAQSRRPDGRAHARWLSRQRLQRSPRARVARRHGTTPPPPSFPQLARRSCKVRVQKALPAHSIPGATSPLRELGLLGRRELLPGDMAVGKGTVGAMGQHPSQGDRHSPLQAPWDPQHHPTGAPTPPVPIDSHTIPLIPTKACTFLLC